MLDVRVAAASLPGVSPWVESPQAWEEVRAQGRLYLDAMNAILPPPNAWVKPYSEESPFIAQGDLVALKAEVSENLEVDTGLPGGGGFLEAWAKGAGDYGSLALQRAAVANHGVPMSYECLSAYHMPGMLGQTGEAEKVGAVIYGETQEFLKAKGVNKLHLFRGMRWNRGTRVPDELHEYEPGSAVKIEAFPLSAFSADPYVAWRFASAGEYPYCVLLAATVPAERVFSLPMKGIGCFYEAEAVILGGPITCAAFPVDPGIPWDEGSVAGLAYAPSKFRWTEAAP